MTEILPIIIGAVALIVGTLLGKFIFAKNTKKQLEEADQQAQRIISDAQTQAETLKKEKILEAKERFVQLKAEHDKESKKSNQSIKKSKV
jgi:ribonuclease Y